MARENRDDERTDEPQVTTDREMIRGWVGEHDATPVRYAGVEGESNQLRIVPEDDVERSQERVEWDEFFSELESSESVVVFRGADAASGERFEIAGRDDVVGRAPLENEEVEAALSGGETVTMELSETTVVEETIQETATVESTVTGREAIQDEIVDAELLDREVVDCELTDAEADDSASIHLGQFEAGEGTTQEFGVELEVDETWAVVREVLERVTVESRITDVDVSGVDTVESDTLESQIDVEGVERTILEGDLLDSSPEPATVIERGDLQSRFREGDVVETHLLERATVEEELYLQRQLEGEITQGRTTSVESTSRDDVEREIVSEEDAGVPVAAETASEAADQGATAAAETETATAETETAAADTETAAVDTGAETGTETAEATAGTDADARRIPAADDEGKRVIDTDGRELGMVTAVEGDTLHVDPEPSLADRIRAALDWGDPDDDAYPVPSDRVVRITDDVVELSVPE